MATADFSGNTLPEMRDAVRAAAGSLLALGKGMLEVAGPRVRGDRYTQ